MAIALKDAGEFGQSVLDLYQKDGWGSLGKRDLELLIYVLLEKDGALVRSHSNYDIARQLRLTEAKVAALRRDAYARWRPLVGEESKAVLTRILLAALKKDCLERTIKFAGRKLSEGFIPFLIEHPDDRAEVEHAVKEANGIILHERNREVILVHYETLLQIAENLGILESDPLKVRRDLKNLLGDKDNLAEFLKKPIGKITKGDARAAMNEVGAIVVEGSLRNLLPGFLKLVIPSIV